MHIPLSAERLAALRAFLERSPDAEALPGGEYVVDLFEREVPLSLELQLTPDGAEVTAAAELAFDEAQDGWYLSGRVEDERAIADALHEIP